MEVFLDWIGTEQLALRRDIVANSSCIIDTTERCQPVRLCRGVEDMVDGNSLRNHCIGDQRAMAAPGNGFGAHDCGRLEGRECEKIVERISELPGFHVVGVRAEAGISPLRVVRIAPAATTAAERYNVRVSAAGVDDRPFQTRLREVWVPRRCWKGAHIDEMCRAFSGEQSEELVERSGRVTDREKLSGVHAPRSCLPPRAASPRAA